MPGAYWSGCTAGLKERHLAVKSISDRNLEEFAAEIQTTVEQKSVFFWGGGFFPKQPIFPLSSFDLHCRYITSCALNSIALGERFEDMDAGPVDRSSFFTEDRLRALCHENTPDKIGKPGIPNAFCFLGDCFS